MRREKKAIFVVGWNGGFMAVEGRERGGVAPRVSRGGSGGGHVEAASYSRQNGR